MTVAETQKPDSACPCDKAADGPCPPRRAAEVRRWTLQRLVEWVAEQFKRVLSRETVRRALKRLGLSWKKGKKLLSRADPEQRPAFVERIKELLAEAASSDDQLLVYIDEAHIPQDADLGYGWSKRGGRLWVPSTSPGSEGCR